MKNVTLNIPETNVSTICHSHCGGACPMRIYLSEGKIEHIEANNDNTDTRPCARGRAYRQRTYSNDRVLYPLRRSGNRGEGKFEKITWSEALDTIASKMLSVKKQYGPQSLLYLASVGDVTWVHNPGLMERLFSRLGGYSGPWGMASGEGAFFATMASYGMPSTGNMREDFLNSRLIILWGWNPAVTSNFANTRLILSRAHESGTKIIVVDPRYTDSAAIYADQWIPIKPGTDAAMLISMAYVILTDQLEDKNFINRYTKGMDIFFDYVLGKSDQIPKTPEWAERITGVPLKTIEALAHDYARLKPAALMDGFAPGRSAFGEQFHRAAIALASLTGNLGVPGSSAPGCACLGDQLPALKIGPQAWQLLKAPENTVDKAAHPRPESPFYKNIPTNYYSGNISDSRVNRFLMADAILGGKKAGYPTDYKFAYIVNFNYVNQYANSNKIAAALKTLDFVVVQDQCFTATAKFADILLPSCTFLERNDFTNGGIDPFFGYMKKAIEPLGESKSHLDIANELADRLGIQDIFETDEEGYLKTIVENSQDVASFDSFNCLGIKNISFEKPYICFQKQISDPDNNPFPTPSKKIEIYSEQMAEIGNPKLPPIPNYIAAWEGPDDPLYQQYPLQMISTHTLRRAHSQFEDVPWLKELYEQCVFINPTDAKNRGINNGDMVRVFNDRGTIRVKASVTQRVMVGVIDLPQGAWYHPNKEGIDIGACANTLTNDKISPGGAFCSNNVLVEVAKI